MRNAGEPVGPLRHWGGFVIAGGAALVTDALILMTLTRYAGLSPFAARLIAIPIAMVVSWLINRRLAFAVAAPPTAREFLRFAGVSWFAQAVNYAVFAAILLVRPATHPVAALIGASLLAMIVSYLGFRFGVFQSQGPARDP